MGELPERDLLKLLAKHMPEKWDGLKGFIEPTGKTRHAKKRLSYDTLPDLSPLPEGQHRAIRALIGGKMARTYPEAARIAGMSLGTILTHVNRVRRMRPKLYQRIREVRLAQLNYRHEDALEAARAHSAIYFRKRAKWLRQWLF